MRQNKKKTKKERRKNVQNERYPALMDVQKCLNPYLMWGHGPKSYNWVLGFGREWGFG